ncbi:MAG: recombinase family protein [Abditibacteriaceae bacterium]
MINTDSHIAKRTKRMRFVGYLRVSMEKETTGSFTFETQEQRIREMLDEIYGPDGYDLIFIKDNGLSGSWGYKPTPAQPRIRPGLKKVADMLENDEADGVIVYDQNRLYRDLVGLLDFIYNVVKPNDKVLLSTEDDIDLESLDSMFLLSMKGLFHQRVKDDIVKRCRDATASRAEGGYPVGQVGFGHEWDPKVVSGGGQRRGIVAVVEEKEVVLKIKDLYLSGCNATKIADELNELKVPSPLQRKLWTDKAKKQRARDGREPKWTNGTVWNTLRNPLHAGLIKLRSGELKKGQHYEQRFWDPEVLQQIEQLHELRIKRFKTVTGQKNKSHLLSGLIFCNRCGKRLYVKCSDETNRQYRAYYCVHCKHEGQSKCHGVSVRAQWVEDAVVEEVVKLSKNPFMRRLLDKEIQKDVGNQDVSLKKENVTVKRRLAQNEDQLNGVLDLHDKGDLSKTQLQVRLRKLETEQITDSARLEKIEKSLANRLGRELSLKKVQKQLEDFPSVWAELDNDEKHQVLSLLLEDSSLKADLDGLDIVLRMKVHLLPEVERRIMNRSFRGVARSLATGLQRLTLRQMELLYYAGQGKTRRESAGLMGCERGTIFTLEKTIRKNLGDVTWAEAIEMSREQVEANLAQLPFGLPGRKAKNETKPRPFISPVLMEAFVLFAKGASVPEASERLGLPRVTVQGRRSRILKLMGTPSIMEAAEKAREWGILAG